MLFVLATGGLLLLNAFFVFAEHSLVRTLRLRRDGNATSAAMSTAIAKHVEDNLSAYLHVCQLGTSLATMSLGLLAAPILAANIDNLSTAFNVLILLSVYMLLGQQIPQMLARHDNEHISPLLLRPLYFSYKLLTPLLKLVQASASALFYRRYQADSPRRARGAGGAGGVREVKEVSESKVANTDTGCTAMPDRQNANKQEDHEKAGKSWQAALQEVLPPAVQPGQNKLWQLMVDRSQITALDISLSPKENQQRILAAAHSYYPLLDGSQGDRVVGVISAAALLQLSLHSGESYWQQLKTLCRPSLCVTSSTSIDTLYERMLAEGCSFATVNQPLGPLIGIVTMTDLVRGMTGSVEPCATSPSHRREAPF